MARTAIDDGGHKSPIGQPDARLRPNCRSRSSYCARDMQFDADCLSRSGRHIAQEKRWAPLASNHYCEPPITEYISGRDSARDGPAVEPDEWPHIMKFANFVGK